MDSQKVAALKELVGFEKIKILEEGNQITLVKSNPEIELEFGGVAKGYGVDAVSELLEGKGINRYLVEIGLETRAAGKSSRNDWWRIGINTPREDAEITDIEAIAELQNKSLASSGNYRNYYEVDGRKYGHEINPKTGYSEQSELLSVSVFAKDCITADAYATAFMILGMEKSENVISKLDGVDALFHLWRRRWQSSSKIYSGELMILLSRRRSMFYVLCCQSNLAKNQNRIALAQQVPESIESHKRSEV